MIHNEHMEIIKNELKNVKYVCTTADVWTAPDRRILGVTAHWLCEKTLKRKSAALACKRIEGTHSAEIVATELDKINELFELNYKKIVATVTDNGSNFVKAFKMFGISSCTILKDGPSNVANIDELEKTQMNDPEETEMSDDEINEIDEDYGDTNYDINDNYNDNDNNANNDDNGDNDDNNDNGDNSIDNEEISDEINIILP
ncbi:NAD-dependent protein deacetylase Sir2B-like [Nylanderia fulva]|uniref:NAD-dependent protein deacetylase Sir2B-like n=1 Tax=Nylanderia fulva TaxID=613905 RepID=UPI0010FB008B|nr:NAD-dependent protein deacetylase Sir2B-like [Nylanderia fulva]XP_029159614.1 NAD-dependent protein deacetylase Sir2B-like [Nylanderia fulva]